MYYLTNTAFFWPFGVWCERPVLAGGHGLPRCLNVPIFLGWVVVVVLGGDRRITPPNVKLVRGVGRDLFLRA